MKVFDAVQEFKAFSLKELNWPNLCSVKPRYRSAYQRLDNVKIHLYQKFEPNIPQGSIVTNMFFKRA